MTSLLHHYQCQTEAHFQAIWAYEGELSLFVDIQLAKTNWRYFLMEQQGLRERFWETDLFGSQIVKMHKNHFIQVDIFFPNSSSLVHHQFSGVSIKFEVGSQFEKSRRQQWRGATLAPFARGVWGHAPPPQKNLKPGSSQTIFPAFWASNCV